MKIKEKDLVIGDEYWMDNTHCAKGIFIGVFNDDIYFHPTSEQNYLKQIDGTVSFLAEDYEYEEVE